MLRIASSLDTSVLRERFRRRHWIRLPRLLEPAFLRNIKALLNKTRFIEKRMQVSRRGFSPQLSGVATLLLNDPLLLDFVGDVAGLRGRIRDIVASAYCQTSSRRHCVFWHNDIQHPPYGKKIFPATLIVNIGGTHRGGLLEIRSLDSKRKIARLSNLRAGSAVLFRSSLPHRSTPVVGRRPKKTLVVWFSPNPPLRGGS